MALNLPDETLAGIAAFYELAGLVIEEVIERGPCPEWNTKAQSVHLCPKAGF